MKVAENSLTNSDPSEPLVYYILEDEHTRKMSGARKIVLFLLMFVLTVGGVWFFLSIEAQAGSEMAHVEVGVGAQEDLASQEIGERENFMADGGLAATTCSANKCQGGCWVERHGHETFCDNVGRTSNEKDCHHHGMVQKDNGVLAKTTWCPGSTPCIYKHSSTMRAYDAFCNSICNGPNGANNFMCIPANNQCYCTSTCSANNCQGGCWIERHGHGTFCDNVGKTSNEKDCHHYGMVQKDNGVLAKTTWCPGSNF